MLKFLSIGTFSDGFFLFSGGVMVGGVLLLLLLLGSLLDFEMRFVGFRYNWRDVLYK